MNYLSRTTPVGHKRASETYSGFSSNSILARYGRKLIARSFTKRVF